MLIGRRRPRRLRSQQGGCHRGYEEPLSGEASTKFTAWIVLAVGMSSTMAKPSEAFYLQPRFHCYHQSYGVRQFQRRGYPFFNRSKVVILDELPSARDDVVPVTAGPPPRNPPTLYSSDDPSDQRYAASDWLQNMRSIPRSTILRAIKGPVLAVMVWSTCISLIHRLLLGQGWTAAAARMCIHSKPHSFLVSALGLLLVFRTNSAYQKFAEGRQIWERILSISRSFSRMAMLYEKELGVSRLQRCLRLLSAFPYLLHHHIQPQCIDPTALPCDNCDDHSRGLAFRRSELFGSLSDSRLRPGSVARAKSRRNAAANGSEWRTAVTGKQQQSEVGLRNGNDVGGGDNDGANRHSVPWCLLPESSLQRCFQSVNRPLWICDRLGQEVNQVAYTPNFTSRERLTFLSHIDKLSQCIGECERIQQTAVPLNYARHSLRSLTLWLFTLPFALVHDFGLLTGPVMGLAAWLLYGIYQIGFTIEDPFQGSLRLSILCDAIFRDVMYGTEFMKRRATAFEETDGEEGGEYEQLHHCSHGTAALRERCYDAMTPRP